MNQLRQDAFSLLDRVHSVCNVDRMHASSTRAIYAISACTRMGCTWAGHVQLAVGAAVLLCKQDSVMRAHVQGCKRWSRVQHEGVGGELHGGNGLSARVQKVGSQKASLWCASMYCSTGPITEA